LEGLPVSDVYIKRRFDPTSSEDGMFDMGVLVIIGSSGYLDTLQAEFSNNNMRQEEVFEHSRRLSEGVTSGEPLMVIYRHFDLPTKKITLFIFANTDLMITGAGAPDSANTTEDMR
jgi:hypothetical protein